MSPHHLRLALCDLLGIPHDAIRATLTLEPGRMPQLEVIKAAPHLGPGHQLREQFDLVPRGDAAHTIPVEYSEIPQRGTGFFTIGPGGVPKSCPAPAWAAGGFVPHDTGPGPTRTMLMGLPEGQDAPAPARPCTVEIVNRCTEPDGGPTFRVLVDRVEDRVSGAVAESVCAGGPLWTVPPGST